MSKVVFEIILIVILISCILSIHYTNIEPFQRGFFCTDSTLKYPYIEETVSTNLCFILWILISLFIILTTQVIKRLFSIKALYDIVLGALICILTTLILKYSVGKLRPHFLSLCNPDYNNICYDESAYYRDENDEELLDEFFEKYVNETNICSIENSRLIENARLSFPSGHASYSFYFTTFLILYMKKNLKDLKYIRNILPYINLLLILLATWISFTRVNDYYHFTSDVVFGGFLGVAIGLFLNSRENILLISDKNQKSMDEESEEDGGLSTIERC